MVLVLQFMLMFHIVQTVRESMLLRLLFLEAAMAVVRVLILPGSSEAGEPYVEGILDLLLSASFTRDPWRIWQEKPLC